jgi:hypothetical protein
MIQTLFNLLEFNAQNLIIEVWWCALALWVALLVIAITDVATNTISRGGKLAWSMAIVLVPLVGLFAYCVFCLRRADYYMFEFLTRKRKGPRHKGAGKSTSTSQTT